MKVLKIGNPFVHFNVPVIEKLYEHYGDDFLVVCEKNPHYELSYTALNFGEFPRVKVTTYTWVLSDQDTYGKGTAKHFFLIPALPLVLLRYRPQVIFTANFGFWTLTALFMRLFGTKIVLWWTGSEYSERTVSPFRKLMRKAMAKVCNAYMTNGKLSAEYLMSLGVPREKIVEGATCPNTNSILEACTGEGLEKAKKIKKDIGAEGTTFLFVGRSLVSKGQDHLLEAFHLLTSRLGSGKKVSLIMIGDGPYRQDFEDLARSKNLSNVYFLDHMPPEEVAPYYAFSDIFILPTLQDCWSVVVAEAMTAGKPILTTLFNGCWPDLVQDGVNGFLFDPFNHEEMAEKMGFFLEHPEKIGEFGEKSREIIAPYNPDDVAKAHIRVIDLALSG